MLDDPFFVDFITQHTTSVMYSHVRSVLRAKPDSWLLDLLATKTATEYNYNLVENLRAMRVDGQDDVAYKYLVKFFQKKEKIQNISFGVFENVDDLVFTLNALDDVYPFKDHPDYYFPLKDYLNNTELQLFLLRKYPTLLAENIKSLGSNVLSFIKPEVRAALVDMYPELTYTVGDYEKTTKQPIEHYDEEKQEVIPGNRPNLPETQATASILKLVKIAQKLDNKNYNCDDLVLISSINKKDLSIIFKDTTKIYDGTTNSSLEILRLDGIVNNEKVNITAYNAQYLNKYPGEVILFISNIILEGVNLDNYNIENMKIKTNIFKRKLKYAIHVSDKKYDGNNFAFLNIVLNNILNDEDVHIENFIATYNDENIGNNKEITIKNIILGGIDKNNYDIEKEIILLGNII